MSAGRVRLLATLHVVLCTVLCVTLKPKPGAQFMKSDPFNLSALFTDTEPHSLQDLAGPWSYNDTSDISKYEDFDHSRIVLPGIQFDPPLVNVEEAPQASPPPLGQDLPLFDHTLSTNVSVPLGASAILHCSVRNAKDLRVSWVRRRDWHILSSGAMTYTNDERFQVQHTEGADDWDLEIHYVQRRDNGTYECQVATGSGILSHFYHLHVIVPSAFILGSGEYHIGEGSTISLVCIIEHSPIAPQYVFWYHNDKVVNYESARGGVTVDTEPGAKTHSRLIVNRASPSDTGNYTCRAPNTDPDTIFVYVTKEGENTAAIQRQRGCMLSHSLPLLMLTLLGSLLAFTTPL